MAADEFWKFERAGWERAAARYDAEGEEFALPIVARVISARPRS